MAPASTTALTPACASLSEGLQGLQGAMAESPGAGSPGLRPCRCFYTTPQPDFFICRSGATMVSVPLGALRVNRGQACAADMLVHTQRRLR